MRSAAHLPDAARHLRPLLRARPFKRCVCDRRRGRRHHRRPEHRGAGNAAHDAHVPHRRCRRSGHHVRSSRGSRSCSRRACRRERAQIAEIDGTVEISRDGDTGGSRSPASRVYRDEFPLPQGTKVLVENGQEVEPGTVLPRSQAKGKNGDDRRAKALAVSAGHRRAHVGYRLRSRRAAWRPLRGARAAGLRHSGRLAPRVHDGDYHPRRAAANGRPAEPAGHPAHPGAGEGADISRRRGTEGLPLAGCDHQRQAHRGDRPADAAARPRRLAGRLDLLPGELVDRFSSRPRTRACWQRAANPRRPNLCCLA